MTGNYLRRATEDKIGDDEDHEDEEDYKIGSKLFRRRMVGFAGPGVKACKNKGHQG